MNQIMSIKNVHFVTKHITAEETLLKELNNNNFVNFRECLDNVCLI